MLRLSQLLGAVRLRPFDVTTPQGRSQERHRRIALTALSSGVTKLIAVLTGLISYPLTIEYLGPDRFGVWIVLNTFVVMLSFADLGIGSGLVNALSAASAADDRNQARRYVSSALFLLIAIASILLAIFFIAYPHINWMWVFNTRIYDTSQEAGRAVIVLAASLAANIVIGTVQRIHTGYQDGYIGNLWNCLGMLLSLIAMLISIYLKGGLVWLTISTSAVPLLAQVANGIELLRRRPWLRPTLEAADFAAAKYILGLGFLFFILQIALAIGYQSDAYVVGKVLGMSAVKEYAAPARIFTYLSSILSLVMLPLWPAYGEAVARGDMAWVRRTLRRTIFVSLLISGAAALVLVPAGRPIVQLWMHGTVHPSWLLLVGLGIWTIIYSVSAPFAMFMNGASIVGFQIVIAILMATTNITLSIILTRRIGVSGVIYGSIIAQLSCVIIPTIVYLPRMMRSIEQRHSARGFEVALAASEPELL